MRSHRYACGLVLLVAALLTTACGSSGSSAPKPSAAPPTYPPATGTTVSADLAASITSVLRPQGLPAWAVPPVNAKAARIATGGTDDGAFVAPLRTGPGWCLGYLRGGRPSFGWCTPVAGSSRPVEGGLIFLSMTRVGILARASSTTARLVVVRADGTQVRVALHHGVALATIGAVSTLGDRPVSVEALDGAGKLLGRRSLGWTVARWKAARPRPFVRPTRTQLRAKLAHPQAPCVGTPKSVNGEVSGEITFVSSDAPRQSVSADILPGGFGPYGGKLYVTATKPVEVTLVDGNGARRPIPLGAGRCAYVALSGGDRRAPFRLEARTTTGTLQVTHPGDWAGFPTDGD